MRHFILGVILVVIPVITNAQDTIFIRNGAPIPALIIEKNSTEVKYKKAGQPQSAAIYSVFTSDILKIHYSDGMVADYSAAGKPAETVLRPVDMAGTIKVFKFNVGVGYDYQLTQSNDPLLTFWRFRTSDPEGKIIYKPGSPGIFTDFGFQTGRHIAGGKLDLMFTPDDAIYAVNADNSYEIKLSNFYYNIAMFYGHTINHKQNLALLAEAALNVTFSGGYYKMNNLVYESAGIIGMGYHVATGINWMVSPRIMASCRLGYRTVKQEDQHHDENGEGFYYFLVPVPDADAERLTISWKGVYSSVALSYSFYTKLKQ